MLGEGSSFLVNQLDLWRRSWLSQPWWLDDTGALNVNLASENKRMFAAGVRVFYCLPPKLKNRNKTTNNNKPPGRRYDVTASFQISTFLHVKEGWMVIEWRSQECHED